MAPTLDATNAVLYLYLYRDAFRKKSVLIFSLHVINLYSIKRRLDPIESKIDFRI